MTNNIPNNTILCALANAAALADWSNDAANTYPQGTRGDSDTTAANEEAVRDAEQCSKKIFAAIEAAKKGDWKSAFDIVDEARAIEKKHGDDAATSAFREHLEAAEEAAAAL